MFANLSVGVDNWQRPELIENYYPEGLPEDWRFDFYFNDFRTVLVAQGEWMRWSDAEIEELQTCRRDDSSIFLKIEAWDLNCVAVITRLKLALQFTLAGFLVFDDKMDQEAINQLPGLVTRVSRQFSLPGWQWCCQKWIVSGAPCGWLESLPQDMKLQRACLQDFVMSLPDKNTGRGFFVGGESIKMVQIQNLKTLSELMGY
ncbi:hypothetical protein JX580_03260 [Thiomicrospira microaerophila]|uniref:hypothetical protein n=1 Tax=Thiomicrospira microaerophila TaxID=406020 RepID=UPI00200EB9E4|nr:hypothetical protein [Thiomicrospira microaerophila]UQB42925.1 hypothetical protein JX580_03260 [Thiomicrospira microaerophila]